MSFHLSLSLRPTYIRYIGACTILASSLWEAVPSESSSCISDEALTCILGLSCGFVCSSRFFVIVEARKLEHGFRRIRARIPFHLPSGHEDNDVPTFWLLL